MFRVNNHLHVSVLVDTSNILFVTATSPPGLSMMLQKVEVVTCSLVVRMFYDWRTEDSKCKKYTQVSQSRRYSFECVQES